MGRLPVKLDSPFADMQNVGGMSRRHDHRRMFLSRLPGICAEHLGYRLGLEVEQRRRYGRPVGLRVASSLRLPMEQFQLTATPCQVDFYVLQDGTSMNCSPASWR
jgi:hypothetical protein